MSKETKFTKGEWQVFMPDDDWDFNDSDDEIVIGMGSFLVDPNYYTAIHKVTIEGFSDDSKNADEAKANSHLMKAAPKLYEALYGLISNEDSNLTVNEIMIISELLAEARGE